MISLADDDAIMSAIIRQAALWGLGCFEGSVGWYHHEEGDEYRTA